MSYAAVPNAETFHYITLNILTSGSVLWVHCRKRVNDLQCGWVPLLWVVQKWQTFNHYCFYTTNTSIHTDEETNNEFILSWKKFWLNRPILKGSKELLPSPTAPYPRVLQTSYSTSEINSIVKNFGFGFRHRVTWIKILPHANWITLDKLPDHFEPEFPLPL